MLTLRPFSTFRTILLFSLLFLACRIAAVGQAPLPTPLPNLPIVVSEYINDGLLNGEQQWSEYLITQDNVDLSNFRIFDNNSSQTASQGGVELQDVPFWQNMRRGTIFVLWHKNGTRTYDTEKKDGYIEIQSGNNVNNYVNNPYFIRYDAGSGILISADMNIAGGGDVVEIRTGTNQYIHSLAHFNAGAAGAYHANLPHPKPIMLNNNIPGGWSVFVRGGWATFITPTSPLPPDRTASPTRGLPGALAASATFWRQLRQPDWTSPAMQNLTIDSTTGHVTLQWNSMVDAFPADSLSGYLIVRRLNSAVSLPTGAHDLLDGRAFADGAAVQGDNIALVTLRHSGNTTFIDTTVPCGATAHYRIYAWRFDADDNGSTNLARGRAYNETQFVEGSITRPAAPVISSIQSTVTPLVLCQGQSLTLAPILAAGAPAASFRWLRDGVEVGTDSLLTVTEAGTYTVEVRRSPHSFGCLSSADTAVIVNPLPTLTLSSADTICQNSPFNVASLVQSAAPAGGTFAWDLDDNGAFDQTPAQAAAWTFTTAGEATVQVRYTAPTTCQTTATITIPVRAESIPTLTLGGTSPYCSGDEISLSVTLSAPATELTWDFGDGSTPITAAATQLSRNYTYAAPGTYQVSVTANNGICSRTSNTVSVVITERPQASIAAISNSCVGTPITATYNGTSPTGTTLEWDFGVGATPLVFAGATPPPVVYSTPGTKTVEVSANNGTCVSMASVTFEVFEQLQVSFPTSSIGICAGGSTPLAPTVNGGSPNLTYSWSPATGLSAANIPNPTAAPTTPTTYTLTVSDNNAAGCSSSASVSITINPNLTIIGIDTTICEGQSAQLRIANTSPNYTYSWRLAGGSPFSTDPTPTVSPTTTTDYEVIVNDTSSGCSGTGTLRVTVAPTLAVSISTGDTTLCLGSALSLNATPSRATQTSYLYSWSPAAGLSASNVANPTFTPTATGSVTLTLTVTEATTGCEATSQVTITTVPALSVSLPPTAGICAGSSLTLQPTVSGGSGNLEYEWTASTGVNIPPVASPTVTPSTETVYILTVRDLDAGCSSTASQTVQIAPRLQVMVADSTLCAGTVNLNDFVLSPTGGNFAYEWTDAATNNPIATPTSFTLIAGTTYTFRVLATDTGTGCDGDTVLTLVAPPALAIASISNDTTICGTSQVPLNVQVTGGTDPANFTYQWSPTAGVQNSESANATATVSDNTTFTVVVRDEISGCEITGTVSISLGDSPVIRFEEPARNDTLVICQGEEVELPASVENTTLFLWDAAPEITNRGTLRPTIRPAQSATFTLRAENANCETSRSIVVLVIPRPSISITSPQNFAACEGQSVTLVANSAGALEYRWNTGEEASTITVIRSGVYSVTATVPGSECSVTESIEVRIDPVPQVEILTDSRTVCSGEQVWLRAALTQGTTATFRWSNGQEGDSIRVGAGTYTVRASLGNCESESTPIIISERAEQIVLERAAVDFGLLDKCLTDTVTNFELRNSGTVAYTLTARASENFSVAPAEIRIEAGQSRTIEVGFRPAGNGLLNGEVVFTTRECGTEARLALSGERQESIARVNPPDDISFGDVISCLVEPRDTVLTFENIGTDPIEVLEIITDAPFAIVENIAPNTVIAPGDNLPFTVRFSPTERGTFDGRVRISFLADGCSDPLVQRFNVSGRQVEASLVARQSDITLPTLTGCETQRDTLITIVNTGDVDIFFGGSSLVSGSGFALINPPNIIRQGDSTTLRVRFTAAQEGETAASLLVRFEPCGLTTTFNLTGRKEGVSFAVAEEIDMGTLLLGCETELTNEQIQVTLGGSAATGSISGAVFAGGGNRFRVIQPLPALENGTAAALRVAFTSALAEEFTDTLLLTLEPCGEQRRVVVRARGIRPAAQLNTSVVNFGEVEAGESSERFLILDNSGTMPIVIGEDDLPDFGSDISVVEVVPQLPATLAPGERLTLTLEFAPVADVTINRSRSITFSPAERADCRYTASFQLQARGLAPAIAPIRLTSSITPPLVIASPNEIITFEVRGGYEQAIGNSQIEELSGTVFFNPTLLQPLQITVGDFPASWQSESQEEEAGALRMRLRGEATEPVREGLLFTVRFRMLLGDERETAISFVPDTAYLNNLTGQPTVANSPTAAARLDDSCDVEGRLVDFGNSTRFKIRNGGNSTIIVEAEIYTDDYTTIELFDVRGVKVAAPAEHINRAGTYTFVIKAHAFAQGSYFGVLRSGNIVRTVPFIFIKD